ncbi:hypothetical protein V6N13_048463 [Hibiscus sabdariffa]
MPLHKSPAPPVYPMPPPRRHACEIPYRFQSPTPPILICVFSPHLPPQLSRIVSPSTGATTHPATVVEQKPLKAERRKSTARTNAQ